MSRIARTESVGDSLCPVCHEHTEIYAIGPCDHPICYKCSTRMRALCGQMDCPICRGDLPQVVFLTSKRKYDEVDRRNCIPNRKYKILLEDESVEDGYEALLEHRCRICNSGPLFENFSGLRQHMSRNHTLFPCQLCIDHLKIFPYERKFYSRKDLATHRRSGDADNRSYRGHPICHFCDERYMDNDELLRHLRKSHYYCHFCDVNCSNNEYFNDYPDLRRHFRTEHFLCEEEQCGLDNTQFTNAFATEIDLKAHKTSEHMGNKSKAQSREMRTIDVNFQMAPRRRGRDNQGVVTPEDFEEFHGSGRGHRDRRQRRQDRFEANVSPTPEACGSAVPPQPPVLGDDFPTLGNGPAPYIPTAVQKPTPVEDFPSLSAQRQPGLAPATTAALIPKSAPAIKSGAGRAPGRAPGPKPSHNLSASVTTAATPQTKIVQSQPQVTSVPAQTNTVSQNSWKAPRLASGEDFPSLKSEKQSKPAKDGLNYVSLGAWTKKQREDSAKSNSRPPSSGGRQSQSPSLTALGQSLCDDGEFPSLGGGRFSKPAAWVQKDTRPNKNKKSKSSTPLGNTRDASLLSKNLKEDSSASYSLGSVREETYSKKKKKKQKEKEEMKNATEDSGISLSSIASEIDDSNALSQHQGSVAMKEESSNASQAHSTENNVRSSSSTNLKTVAEKSKNKEPQKMSVSSEKEPHVPELLDSPRPATSTFEVVKSSGENKENKKNEATSNNSRVLQEDDFLSLAAILRQVDPVSKKKDSKKELGGVKKSNAFQEQDFPSLQALPKKTAPPPGFQKPQIAAPPPGLATVAPMMGRSPPGLSTSISNSTPCPLSLGSNGTSIPMSVKVNMYTYIPPVDSAERNSALVSRVRKVLILKEGGFDQFRALSSEFRSGQILAQAYHKQCQDLFGQERFLEVLPELVALLPDILKQHELAEAHKLDILGICAPLGLSSCPTCHQLLRQEDCTVHLGMHANLVTSFSSTALPVET